MYDVVTKLCSILQSTSAGGPLQVVGFRLLKICLGLLPQYLLAQLEEPVCQTIFSAGTAKEQRPTSRARISVSNCLRMSVGLVFLYLAFPDWQSACFILHEVPLL